MALLARFCPMPLWPIRFRDSRFNFLFKKLLSDVEIKTETKIMKLFSAQWLRKKQAHFIV